MYFTAHLSMYFKSKYKRDEGTVGVFPISGTPASSLLCFHPVVFFINRFFSPPHSLPFVPLLLRTRDRRLMHLSAVVP